MTELQDKIRVAMENYDAVIATGVDNFTYPGGIVLPFASNCPDRKAAVLKTVRALLCIRLSLSEKK